jgi:hypothetical protein
MKSWVLAFFAVAFLVLSTPYLSATVDETLAKRWIERGFLTLSCNSPADQPADISQRYDDPTAVKNAWAFLKQCRDQGLTSSQEAVAAENYLYIRYVVGATGDTAFKVFPWSYYLLKTAGSEAGFLQSLRTNPDNPVSDPDPDVRKWGDRGYDDGILDYEARTGQQASLKTDAAQVAYKFLADLFYN